MRIPVILCFSGLFALYAQEEAPDAAVVELRATIGKIVDTQALRSKEVADWEARKEEMSALLEIQKRELSLLTEELEKAGTSAGDFDERKREAEADLEALKETRRVVKEAVAAARPRMLALAGRLPDPLLDETENERAVLDAWEADSEARDGLQAILGIIAKAETFNRRFTRSEEVRDGREVEVIYLGLAAAYYADRSGNAGVGIPGPDGWEWKAQPELSEVLGNVFDQLDRKRPPEVVELPVQILPEGGAK